MNAIAAVIFVAFLAYTCGAPLDERGFKEDALERAKGVKACIEQYKGTPDANQQIPKCVLQVFSAEVTVAKEKFSQFLQTASKDVTDYFMNAGKEVRGFYESAKAKVFGYVDVVGEKLGSLKDTVFGWVEKTVG